MLTKFNLYIGLNDKDSKVQEISTLSVSRLTAGCCEQRDITINRLKNYLTF